MKKKEIEHRIKRYELVRECAEENLNELNIQLAEAEKLEKLDKLLEKPKLRHGDFGYCDEPLYPRIVLGEDKLASGSRVFDRHKNDEPTVILGNVFDLMKGWNKPFKGWGDSKASKGVKIVGNRIEFYACTDGSCSKRYNPCSDDVEEFHNALGHAIAELKQKK